jgi:hypothetical protein
MSRKAPFLRQHIELLVPRGGKAAAGRQLAQWLIAVPWIDAVQA